MTSNKKIIISMSIIGLLLVSLAISYAYFSAKITNNESESTIVATAAYLELTFIDGSPEINASNILPGWSACKTFSVQNTGDSTAYYVLKITDINNPFVYGGISYKIESNNGGANVALDTLPLANMPVTGPIEIQVNTTHNYTITTYYNELEENQLSDLGKSFSYTVSIEAVYKKEIQYIEDLVDLSNEVNSGTTYEHTWFVLTRDLDFNSDESYKNANNTTTYGDYNGNGTVEAIKTELTTGSGFIPIGITGDTIYDNNFMGNFDGGNYRLDNLYINNNKSGKYIGLFGRIIDSTISNLTLSGDINSSVQSIVSGIVSTAAGVSNLYNLVNEADITILPKTNNSISGICASTAAEAKVYIKNSTNKGTILGGYYVGGIIGGNQNTLIIENSKNEGSITNNNGIHTGGLIGKDLNNSNITKIYNSYNIGNNTSELSGKAIAIGGLIGKINGELDIYNSYNLGNITQTKTGIEDSSYYIDIGGIGGLINKGIIEKCYNKGAITGGNRNGGIIGRKASTTDDLMINKSYNTGNVTSEWKNSYDTTIGGIIGYTEVNRGGKVFIFNSYNNGNIVSDISKSHAGGIIGKNTMIIHVVNSYNAGSIGGSYRAGGIIGAANNLTYIDNVYNFGDLLAGSKKYGIFAVDTENTDATTVFNAYHLDSVSGSNIAEIGTALTTQYMASPEFVNLLNQNKRSINLSTIYSGALSAYSSYELSDWKYDAEKGYPVLDN